ncbi:hypothetical protein ACIOWF_06735 [Cellulosimicrobium cellulans]|uniref:hypothetical protein n=1 Tax=Cellulosimicrobium cellulans TaxID=1710 RepID=UPI0038224B0B
MGKPNRRRVRMAQFKQQVAEHVLPEDQLVPVDVEVGDDVRTVWIKVGLNLTADDDFTEQVKEAKDADALALVVLGGHPEHDAEEQLATWKAAGYTVDDLAMLFGTESRAAQERLGNFRYAG